MTWQYHYDQTGKSIGVFIPIDEWHSLQDKYQELANVPTPIWQNSILDERLKLLAANPNDITSLDVFWDELNELTNGKV